jgi:hypothetical protein
MSGKSCRVKCVKFMKHDKWLVWSQHKNTNGSVGQSNHSDDMIYSGRNYWSVTPEHLNRFVLNY